MEDGELDQQVARTPRGWSAHPTEKMLITPWVAGIGGLLVFLTVVFVVVWLPTHTFDPPASGDWAPPQHLQELETSFQRLSLFALPPTRLIQGTTWEGNSGDATHRVAAFLPLGPPVRENCLFKQDIQTCESVRSSPLQPAHRQPPAPPRPAQV